MIRRLRWVVLGVLVLLLPLRAAAQDVVEYYGTDAIGSVRIVFDANGNIVGRMDYGPFGEQVTVSTVGQKSYAGLFRDGEAGLDYAEARSNQVRTGRFNAPDPVYAGMFAPQAWNRYSYALNNPNGFVDPTGLVADSCTTVDTYSKDGEHWVLNTTLKCKDSGGGGGGGGAGFNEFLGWLATRVGDLLSGTSVVLGGDELYPTARYRPSPRVEAGIDAALLVAAIAVGVKTVAAGAASGAVESKAITTTGKALVTPPSRIYSARELVR